MSGPADTPDADTPDDDAPEMTPGDWARVRAQIQALPRFDESEQVDDVEPFI